MKTFDEIIGKIVKEIIINKQDNTIKFSFTDGEIWEMLHEQDCCEDVYIESVCGDVSRMENEKLLIAEVVTNDGSGKHDEFCTWTFYKFATNKETLTIRWYGESNGYYSEDVTFRMLDEPVSYMGEKFAASTCKKCGNDISEEYYPGIDNVKEKLLEHHHITVDAYCEGCLVMLDEALDDIVAAFVNS